MLTGLIRRTISATFFLIAAETALSTAVNGQVLFVTHAQDGTIGEYDPNTGATINASLISGLNFPEGIAVSGSDIFVTNISSGTVGEYSTSGATINASLITNLFEPTSIAVWGSHIFVSDEGVVGEYDAKTGAVISRSFIRVPSSDAIAVSGSDIFVSNSGNGTIGEYDANTGAAINASLVSGLYNNFGIALSGPNIFVSKFIPPSGNGVGEYSTSGATISSSLISPTLSGTINSIAVFGSDILIADGDTIDKYDASTGAIINESSFSQPDTPYGIAVVIPEPSTYAAIFGSAALGLVAVCRRYRHVGRGQVSKS